MMRELRTTVRGRRAFLIRMAFIAVLAAVVVLTWGSAVARLSAENTRLQQERVALVSGSVQLVRDVEEEGERSPRPRLGGATLDIRQLPNLGRELLETFSAALLLLLLAIVPAYAGGAICSEREQRTLEMTLVTRLGPYSFTLGKLGATLTFSVLLLLAAVPVMAALFMLGGVSAKEMASVVAILLFSALFVGSVSLFWSARCRHTYEAVMLSYVTLLLLHFAALPGIAAGLKSLGRSAGEEANVVLREGAAIVLDFDPVHGLARVFEGRSGPDVWTTPGYVTSMLLLMLALIAVKLTTRAVARVDLAPGPALWQRLMRWFTARESRRRPGRGLRWRWLAERVDNPVLARDLRGRPFGRVEVAIRAGYVGIIGAEVLCIVYPSVLVFSETTVMVIVGAVALISALAGVLGATSVTVEKEQRTIEMLLVTPLRAPHIVSGKFASSFINVQPLILIALPLGALAATFQTLDPLAAVVVLVVAEAYAFGGTAFGVLTSVVSSRTARAVGATLLAIGASWAGPALMVRLGAVPAWLAKWAAPTPAWNVVMAFQRGEGLEAAPALWCLAWAACIGLLSLFIAMRVFDRATRRGR